MKNKLIKIQEMLYDEMQRLSDDEIVKSYAKREVSRSQALTQSAGAFIKSINTQLQIKNMVATNKVKEEDLLKELGVVDEENN